MRHLAIKYLFLGMLMCLALPAVVGAEQNSERLLPTRYGVALLSGAAYDPDQYGLLIVQGQALLDYERVAWHRAPDALRLKLEANLGIKTKSPRRGLASVNAMALYYLEPYRQGNMIPFVEAGIGLIYTDYQVDGQGLHLNFNPQAGVGIELARTDGSALTAGLRLHHVSNGGLHDDNRGTNAALLMIGYLF